MIVVWSSEVFIRISTVIRQWSIIERLSVTFQDTMGCKHGDIIVRSITYFEVPDVPVRFPSFRMLSWFMLIKFRN